MDSRLQHYESVQYNWGDDIKGILGVVSGRYIGANPPVPFTHRAFNKSGILQNEEGLYEIDLNDKLPDATSGDYSYALGKVWSDSERSIDSLMEALGPVRLFLNRQLLYRSSVIDELKPDARVVIPLLLKQGWNFIMLEARKTAAGFGCRFGAEEAKVRLLQVQAPFVERSGAGGWVFSLPTSTCVYGDEGFLPDSDVSERESGLEWLPELQWSKERASLPNMERLFGRPGRGAAGYGWSAVRVTGNARSLTLRGRAHGAIRIWLDSVLVAELDGGDYSFVISESGSLPGASDPYKHSAAESTELKAHSALLTSPGTKQLLVWTAEGDAGWGFELEASAGETPLELVMPVQVHGSGGAWLYAGPMAAEEIVDPDEVCCISRLLNGLDGPIYWSLDAPGTSPRPYYENAMLSNKWTTGSATNYGRWDYPLGVTMYGLLRTAQALERPDIASYALSHIAACTAYYEYSLWDRDQYGFPAINHQLVLMRMLDNCGSFGSAMLEANAKLEVPGAREIADTIAEFMLDKLERRADGAFYRTCEGEYSADTMWADDLYMSTPFLIRYSLLTASPRPLDEAARQFLLYRRYLYMPDEGVMSHVYDFKYGQATGIPWGRGNGWVLFSLSELLEHLPQNHEARAELEVFFEDLCLGIAKLQAESGLWRQVLNQPDAYEEASCTAMFTYAFARGVRFRWLKEPQPFLEAAERGWRGLTRHAIDRQGNVHGVCSGSRYAFTPDYYMYDLRTVLNDNHGIGIMMLAGAEMLRLKDRL